MWFVVLCVIHFFSFSLLVYKVSMCILALMPTCHVLWLLNRKRLQQCFQWASSSGAAAVHPQMTSDYRGTAAVWAFSSCLTVVSHKFSNTVVATPRVKKKGFCSESQHNIRMVWILELECQEPPWNVNFLAVSLLLFVKSWTWILSV